MFDEVLAVVLDITGPGSELHGIDHWRRVAHNGIALAAETDGADKDVVEAFAALHDACRVNDEDDPGHGERGGALAQEFQAIGVLNLNDERMQKLVFACRTHTDGAVSRDPTVGVCFDADRLDLPRVGVQPSLALFSTLAARRRVISGLEAASALS